MNDLVNSSIQRYHEKQAGNFLTDWVKKNIKLPSKDKALKVLRDNIKTEEDVEELFKSIPKMINLLRSKKAADDPLFPPGFVKNLAILIAMISLLSHIQSKEHVIEQLKEKNIIQVDQKSKTKNDKLLGAFPLSDSVIKSLKGDHSIESMNKILIKEIKNTPMQKLPRGLTKVNQVKHPLELKFTTDKAGRNRLYHSQVNKLKDGDRLYVHREYTTEKMKQIEDNLKKLKKERI